MTRFPRILTGFDTSSVADPPEAVNVESDFVVILAALLCALVCVVGLIAVARCAWLRRSASASGPPSRGAANKGLKKKIIQSLPKFTYGAVMAADSCKFASTECAICLGEFGEKDEIRILPQCGHGFHVGCIDTWLGSHSSCPSCRQILGLARCQKCGQFPPAIAISSSSGGGVAEADSKSRVDNCNDDNHNQRHNLGDGFLP